VRPPKLQLKIKTGAAQAVVDEIIQAAHRAGASSVRPLLPETNDAELASLFVIDAKDARAVTKLLKLAEHKSVEFVEPEVVRKLKRP
jgi:hypothetical protein